MARRAVLCEIRRRRAQHAPVAGEFSRDQRRILQRADAHRQINAFIDEIDYLVGHPQVERHARIAAQKFGDHRRYMLTPERRRHRHAQTSLRLLERASNRCTRGISGVEQRAGALGENLAFLRDADPPGRAMQKPRAKLSFELGEPGARYGGG